VLVTLHDGVPVPKVIDFGVAKAIHQRLTEHTVYTQVAQMVAFQNGIFTAQEKLAAVRLSYGANGGARILSAQDPSEPPTPVPTPTTLPATAQRPANEFRLDRFTVTGIDVLFEDRTSTPPTLLPLKTLDLEVRDLSSDHRSLWVAVS